MYLEISYNFGFTYFNFYTMLISQPQFALSFKHVRNAFYCTISRLFISLFGLNLSCTAYITVMSKNYIGSPSLLHNGYRVCFPKVKSPVRDFDHPPISSAEVKEVLLQYLYSPFCDFMACSRVKFTFTLYLICYYMNSYRWPLPVDSLFVLT
jgi:hypothetical protein